MMYVPKCLDLQLGQQDEYFDEDAFENYVDKIDDDGSYGETVEPSTDCEGVTDIDIEAVQERIVQSEKRWLKVGNNSNRRGAGTSKSTYERIKKKAAENILAAKGSLSIGSFYQKRVAEAILGSGEDGTTSENENEADGLIEALVGDEALDETPVMNFFEEIALGFEVNNVADPTPNQRSRKAVRVAEAIKHLLENEAKITRNVQIEKKKGLEHWLVIQK